MLPIYINNYSGLSVLGKFGLGCPINLSEPANRIRNYDFFYLKSQSCPVARISDESLSPKVDLPKGFERSDRIVDIALSLAHDFIDNKKAAKADNNRHCGIFIGSSRAATGLFESTYSAFLNQERLKTVTSPLTTHANVASAVAAKLDIGGFGVEHSVTCSSGLFSLIDAIAWLRSSMLDKAIAGGVEAPLTDYTLAQMLALKIYSKISEYPFSRPFELNQMADSFVLGEGGALFELHSNNCLDSGSCGLKILGCGVGYENSNSLVAISDKGLALGKAMEGAVSESGDCPDLIIAHAPGTILGDRAEAQAIKNVFGKQSPFVLSTKFLFGHTLGASGALSLAFACNILESQNLPDYPYETIWGKQVCPNKIQKILINATGFGGTAVSVLVGI